MGLIAMRRVVVRVEGTPDGAERTERLAALLSLGLERLLRGRPDDGLDNAANLSLHGDGPATGHREEADRGA